MTSPAVASMQPANLSVCQGAEAPMAEAAAASAMSNPLPCQANNQAQFMSNAAAATTQPSAPTLSMSSSVLKVVADGDSCGNSYRSYATL